jgi:predicted metal-dependent phosphoesterase TrpH
MTFLPGMELSARHEWRSVHVLAYLFDPDAAALRALTDRIRSSRLTRAREMAERIGRDYDLTWDDVLDQTATGATVGRPHLADALVAKGHVRDRGGVRRHPQPRQRLLRRLYAPDPVTAVAAVTDAGGCRSSLIRRGAGLLPDRIVEGMLAAGSRASSSGIGRTANPRSASCGSSCADAISS